MFLFRRRRRSVPPPTIAHKGVQYCWTEEYDQDKVVFFLTDWGGALHQVPRTGWIIRGAEIPEWNLDHSTLTKTVARNLLRYVDPKSLARGRVPLLLEVHDFGEEQGDPTPYGDLVPRDARGRRRTVRDLPVLSEDVKAERRRLKTRKERAAIKRMCALLHPDLGRRYFEAWEEYLKGETPEAKFAHQVHALVDCVRALWYKHHYPREEFSSFFATAREEITDATLLELVEFLWKIFQSENGPTHKGSLATGS